MTNLGPRQWLRSRPGFWLARLRRLPYTSQAAYELTTRPKVAWAVLCGRPVAYRLDIHGDLTVPIDGRYRFVQTTVDGRSGVAVAGAGTDGGVLVTGGLGVSHDA